MNDENETPESKLLPRDRGRKWEPGVVARFPLIGFGAMFLSICCTGAAIAIVLVSDGKPTSAWYGNQQPGVLLAYTSTLANALMAVAFTEAVVVGYWIRALRGVRLSNLHYNWYGGSGAMGALTSLAHRKAYFVSTVCLCVTVTSLLRGPLMQRAIFVQTVTFVSRGDIKLELTHQIDENWAASTNDRSYRAISFWEGFSTAIRQFQARTPMHIRHAKCDNCSLTVEGFGFDVDCTTGNSPYPYSLSTANWVGIGSRPGARVFSSIVDTSVEKIAGEQSSQRYLRVNITRRAKPEIKGYLVMNICLLKPARVKYWLHLDGAGNATLQSGSWRNDSVIERMSSGSSGRYGLTVQALAAFGSTVYDSTSYIEFQGGAGWLTQNERILANVYACLSGSECPEDDQNTFRDPMDDVINSFRELALRMPILGSYGITGRPDAKDSRGKQVVPLTQTVPYTSQIQQVKYAADKSNLVLGVMVSLLGPLATLALFWGWWELGRPFSLSPLEVANAFYLPPGTEQEESFVANAFAGCRGNATAGDIVQVKNGSQGDLPVRYGIVGDSDRLVMASDGYGNIRGPMPGEAP